MHGSSEHLKEFLPEELSLPHQVRRIHLVSHRGLLNRCALRVNSVRCCGAFQLRLCRTCLFCRGRFCRGQRACCVPRVPFHRQEDRLRAPCLRHRSFLSDVCLQAGRCEARRFQALREFQVKHLLFQRLFLRSRTCTVKDLSF